MRTRAECVRHFFLIYWMALSGPAINDLDQTKQNRNKRYRAWINTKIENWSKNAFACTCVAVICFDYHIARHSKWDKSYREINYRGVGYCSAQLLSFAIGVDGRTLEVDQFHLSQPRSHICHPSFFRRRSHNSRWHESHNVIYCQTGAIKSNAQHIDSACVCVCARLQFPVRQLCMKMYCSLDEELHTLSPTYKGACKYLFLPSIFLALVFTFFSIYSLFGAQLSMCVYDRARSTRPAHKFLEHARTHTHIAHTHTQSAEWLGVWAIRLRRSG